MEKTTVTEINHFTRGYPLSEYMCDECGDIFIDRDDNYAFCPYCGRKINEVIKEFKNDSCSM